MGANEGKDELAPGESPWADAGERLAERLAVDPERGLRGGEAARRSRAHGPNRLRETRSPGPWRIVARQFASWIVALLAAAAAVAFAFGEWVDGVAIAAVLAINAAIGFVTELRAVRSMNALRRLGSVRSRVRRDGREALVAATELVPGDVLLVEAGDVVTADARLLVASKLEVDESALTGESVPVAKSAEASPADAPVAERTSMVFKGTAATRGTAEALVVATGMDTELGRIAELVQEAEKEATPLEKRLAALGGWLVGRPDGGRAARPRPRGGGRAFGARPGAPRGARGGLRPEGPDDGDLPPRGGTLPGRGEGGGGGGARREHRGALRRGAAGAARRRGARPLERAGARARGGRPARARRRPARRRFRGRAALRGARARRPARARRSAAPGGARGGRGVPARGDPGRHGDRRPRRDGGEHRAGGIEANERSELLDARVYARASGETKSSGFTVRSEQSRW